MACAAVPIATPTATLSLILKILHIIGPLVAPNIPVIIRPAIVTAGIPPICFDNSRAIGVSY
ncbi:hypothetical protein SH2C18_27230 [Clostridium sediminicola]